MAFDNDELNRRRAERAKRKAQIEARKKQLRKRLLTAAAVTCVAVVILLFSTGVLRFPEKPAVTEPPVTETTVPLTQPTAPLEDITIHLVAGGDVNVTQQVIDSGATEGGYDYTEMFMDVVNILGGADLSLLNFEGTLSGAGAAPVQLLQSLDRAGVDLLQTANSYSVIDGIRGLTATLDGIRDAGMEPVGTFADNQAFQKTDGFLLLDIQGIRVAVAAFTKGMDGMSLPSGSENCVNVLYQDYSSTYQKVDTQRISSLLDSIAAEKPDITIALLHWGSEMNDQISNTQDQICTLMQEKGVDVILGTHSHYVQAINWDIEKGTFVAYSLGDFVGNAQSAGTDYSILLDLEITKKAGTGETSITNYTYTPIYILNDADTGIRVLRIREAMTAYESDAINRVSEAVYQSMNNALERIADRVAGK